MPGLAALHAVDERALEQLYLGNRLTYDLGICENVTDADGTELHVLLVSQHIIPPVASLVPESARRVVIERLLARRIRLVDLVFIEQREPARVRNLVHLLFVELDVLLQILGDWRFEDDLIRLDGLFLDLIFEPLSFAEASAAAGRTGRELGEAFSRV